MTAQSLIAQLAKKKQVECPRCGDLLGCVGDIEITSDTAFEVRWAECPSCGWESDMERTGTSWPVVEMWGEEA